MAVAYASGIALPLLGADVAPALLAFALSLALVCLWRRPWPLGVLLVAAVAGASSGSAFLQTRGRDCRLRLPVDWEGPVEGRLLARSGDGTLPFQIEGGGAGVGGCHEVVRAFAPPGDRLPRAGERIRVEARWEGRSFPEPGRAEWAGRLRLGADWERADGGGLVGLVLSFRGRVQERMVLLWGERSAPFVEALILARREHLDPALADAFALSGIAHLLAISGFHVGVVAAILFGLLRAAGLRHRGAGLASASGCWGYVLGIGAPQAAVRACLLLTLLALARLRGRPVVGVGALGSALLILLLVSPGWLGSVGFQLSFAGTAGLLLLRRPVAEVLEEVWLRAIGRAFPRKRERGFGAALVRWGAEGTAVGLAATIPTLPLLAWHFGRLSLVGVPATLLLAPAISLAIPGIAGSLAVSVASVPLGTFLAGGPALFLVGVEEAARRMTSLPFASVWISRRALVTAILGGALTHLFLRLKFRGRVRPRVRGLASLGGGGALPLLAPLLPLGGSLEVHVLDVGQGEAIALRSPSGRWMLIDAGPRSEGYDAGERRVVPYLKRWGVRRLDALVLTHPHLDHIGGAPAVLRSFSVQGILDPSRPYGSPPYLEVLERARDGEVAWWTATGGMTFDFDGIEVTLPHPPPRFPDATEPADPNDISIVLLVRWGDASVLLTGDAPAVVEQTLLLGLSPVTLLKLGHHGSRTSTSPELLRTVRPRAAVVSAGEGNRFGHPHAEVLERVGTAGIGLFRTDRDGDVRIRLGPDGSLQVGTSR